MTRPDVLIVGGGVIGCAVAYELAKDGLRVTLLERAGEKFYSVGRIVKGDRKVVFS